eukprot:c12361_g1_i1.p2 GENE.c12361_g1_i1~~c12361_g1_i1.p2  ORF type:complete len:115 (+),score=42.16 c12361_g1_i1:248-592(+)
MCGVPINKQNNHKLCAKKKKMQIEISTTTHQHKSQHRHQDTDCTTCSAMTLKPTPTTSTTTNTYFVADIPPPSLWLPTPSLKSPLSPPLLPNKDAVTDVFLLFVGVVDVSSSEM